MLRRTLPGTQKRQRGNRMVPRHHTIHRATPYETQPSGPPTPPQPPKPRHGNNKEEHTKRVTWDRCYNKRFKAHRQQKKQEGYFPVRGEIRKETVRTQLGEDGGKKPQREWSEGEETAVDEEAIQCQITDLLKERDILKATIRLQDNTIENQQNTIKQQRVAIDVGTNTIAMLKRKSQGEEKVNRNLRKEFRRAGRLLTELGK